MDKDLFEVQDIKVFEIMDPNTSWQYYFFRSIDKSFGTSLRYDPFEIKDDTLWLSIVEKIKTLLYNRVKFEDRIYTTEEELLNFINSNNPKYTPLEKLNNVIEYISTLSHCDGESISINIAKDISGPEIWWWPSNQQAVHN
jgi:hypothetical protein